VVGTVTRSTVIGSGADAPTSAFNGNFRAELRETFTDSEIERGLERAPAQIGRPDPMRLLALIRRCCSYAKQDNDRNDKRLAATARGQSATRTFDR
jgi:hypothetical protein